MTLFDAVVFPLSVNTFTSSPAYSTTVITLGNGAEQRIGNWLDSRTTYNAILGIRSKTDILTLMNFFRARKGRLRGFLVLDTLDFQADSEVFGVGDGTTTVFQLIKTYGDVANVDIRPIYKPQTGTVQIFKNGVLQSSGVSVNYTNGLVTFSVAPTIGAILEWDGMFWIPCRFDSDALPSDEIFYDWVYNKGAAAGNIPNVTLLEIRDFV